MKKKLILIGFLIWNFNSLFGQNFCLTPDTSTNMSVNLSDQMRGSNNNSYSLKVYFHVIRRSTGTGGQTYESVIQAFNILNQDFNSHNIYFNWDYQIDYIDRSRYYDRASQRIFNINNHEDGIDIYLYDDDSNSDPAGGLANGVGESGEFYVVGKWFRPPYVSLTTSHTISHEMGHVLFLWHTHYGTDNPNYTNRCQELVNGSNSATCGDYVTDTPADPNLHVNVDLLTCEWLDSGRDSNGDSYNPDEKNMMSYSDISCWSYFSSKQGERMRNAINTLPYLQLAAGLVPFLSSIDHLCYTDSQTLTLSNISTNSVIWEVSPNVKIVSSNNNSITIKAKLYKSIVHKKGWVQATLSNGVILREDFKVGVPFDYSQARIEVHPLNEKNGGLYFQNWTRMYLTNVGPYVDDNDWEWQVQNSMVRPSTSSTIWIKPIATGYITIKARKKNECGCGDWISQVFNSKQLSGGSANFR
jgi:hypothetical protein